MPGPPPSPARPPAAGRRVRPECAPLEGRALAAVTGLTLSASPAILTPISPRNQPHAVAIQDTRPVTIAGEVTGGPGAPALRYQVVDGYGRDQPGGPVAAHPVGAGRWFYSTRIGLSDRRNPRDPLGRQYLIVVTAQDTGGSLTAATPVTVPPAGRLPHRPGV